MLIKCYLEGVNKAVLFALVYYQGTYKRIKAKTTSTHSWPGVFPCFMDKTSNSMRERRVHWQIMYFTWWRHQMETFSALLATCAGNSPVTGEFPAQRPVTRSFDIFFDLRLHKRLSKQSWGQWFKTPSRPYDVTVIKSDRTWNNSDPAS